MAKPEAPKALRCAIYTRKSSAAGLEKDFNSLDAQRESCEAYIHTRAHERWMRCHTNIPQLGYEEPFERELSSKNLSSPLNRIGESSHPAWTPDDPAHC